jgi:hypothetical protein
MVWRLGSKPIHDRVKAPRQGASDLVDVDLLRDFRHD